MQIKVTHSPNRLALQSNLASGCSDFQIGKEPVLKITSNANFRDWFSGSKIVDDEGLPLVLYHSTSVYFDRFRVDHGEDSYCKFGAHFGSIDAAERRVEVKKTEDEFNGVAASKSGSFVIPVFISAARILRLSEPRTGRWGVDDIMTQIMELGDQEGIEVPMQMLEDFYNDELVLDNGVTWVDADQYEKTSGLISFLTDTLGYDAIVYENRFEGGGDSYLLWEPGRIKSAISNLGSYNKDDPRFDR